MMSYKKIFVLLCLVAVATAQDSCNSITDCRTCTAQNRCGWCDGVVGSSSPCQTGFATGPAAFPASSCSGGWRWISSSCVGTAPVTPVPTPTPSPVVPTPTPASCDLATSCTSCASIQGCGWCSQVPYIDRLVDTCQPVGTDGSPNGFLASACLNGWHAEANTCPGVTPPTPTGTGTGTGGTGGGDPRPCDAMTDCSSCAARTECGWCQQVLFGFGFVNTCQPGNALKPSGFDAAACTQGWRFTSSSCAAPTPTTPTPTPTPVVAPGTPCDQVTTCGDCITLDNCGWCASVPFGPILVSRCFSGSDAGPNAFSAAQCQQGWFHDDNAQCPA